MKKLLRLSVWCFLSIFIISAAMAGNDNLWITDFKEAKRLSGERNSFIFALFTGSDWCYYCKKLEKGILSSNQFKQFVKKYNLVLLFIDFPAQIKQTEALKKQNIKLKEHYDITGFPTTILLDQEGKPLHGIVGGYGTNERDEYIRAYKEFIDKYCKDKTK